MLKLGEKSAGPAIIFNPSDKSRPVRDIPVSFGTIAWLTEAASSKRRSSCSQCVMNSRVRLVLDLGGDGA